MRWGRLVIRPREAKVKILVHLIPILTQLFFCLLPKHHVLSYTYAVLKEKDHVERKTGLFFILGLLAPENLSLGSVKLAKVFLWILIKKVIFDQ